jgi:hypothetical protein
MKIPNCSANIFFKQQCFKKSLIPDYANIKISDTSSVVKVHQNKGAENMQNFKFAKEFKMNTKRMGVSSLFVRVYNFEHF